MNHYKTNIHWSILSFSLFSWFHPFWVSINSIYSSGFWHNSVKQTQISLTNLKNPTLSLLNSVCFFLHSIIFMAEISGSSNGHHSVSLNIKDESTAITSREVAAEWVSVSFIQKVFPDPLHIMPKSHFKLCLCDWLTEFVLCFWCGNSWLLRLWGHISWFLLVGHQWLWIWAKTKSSLSQGFQLFGVWL